MKGLIFTYLLTYGGALASLYRPYWGLLIYICFALVNPAAMWFFSVPPGNYSRIVAIALLVGWCLHGFGDWRFGRARPIVILFVVFLLWACVMAIPVFDSAPAWFYVETHAKIVLPFLVGITVINSVQQLKQLAWVIVVSQGYMAYEFNVSYYEGFNRMREGDFAGLDNNDLAIAMDSGIGLAFFLGLHAERWWGKAVAFGSALVMGHAVMFSNSRGGMLGLILTGGVSFLLIRKQPKHYLALLVAILIGVRLAGAEVQERFMTTFSDSEHRDGSAGLRVRHWKACADSILTSPLGAGPNQWQFVAPRYGLPSMEGHSHWLQTGAELGLPGLGALVGFYLLTMIRLWPLARERVPVSDPWLAYMAQMVIASLFGFAIPAQFVTCWGVEIPYYVTLLGVGVLKVVSAEAAANAARGAPAQVARLEFAQPPYLAAIGPVR
jgi:putative inorganic carbon (hco3(-)) transporter